MRDLDDPIDEDDTLAALAVAVAGVGAGAGADFTGILDFPLPIFFSFRRIARVRSFQNIIEFAYVSSIRIKLIKFYFSYFFKNKKSNF